MDGNNRLINLEKIAAELIDIQSSQNNEIAELKGKIQALETEVDEIFWRDRMISSDNGLISAPLDSARIWYLQARSRRKIACHAPPAFGPQAMVP